MAAHPILILQMQRMGDLVLSFPLFNQLRRQFPRHPLWVVGEEQFFVPLMPLSPQAIYFPYSHKAALQKTTFSLVINLSHRAEAAELAGSLRCDELVGPYRRNGEHHINGQWQLYRASIAHNNQYNRFHWSDLNALDCIPLSRIAETNWPSVRAKTTASPCKVGLFLGASEQNKRPDAAFWTGLARYLLRRGLHPVLLGGNAEKSLGHEVAKGIGSHALNLCGHFDIHQLYLFIKQLDALISPDTGPMHIATWAGTRVVNLSMGNVSPWETGPMSPGHFVIRGNVDCLDCWQCTRPKVLCKEAFQPAHVGRCVEALLASPESPPIPETVKDLHILRSFRRNGLHGLEPLPFIGSQGFLNSEETQAHAALALFWQSWFADTLGLAEDPGSCLEASKSCRAALQDLHDAHPVQSRILMAEGQRLLLAFSHAIKTDRNPFVDDGEYWKQFAEPLLPLTGFIQLLVQNAPSTKAGFNAALHLCEKFLALVTP